VLNDVLWADPSPPLSDLDFVLARIEGPAV
jgi:hypothetical protein